jgi:sigma-B regulation protein RsbU (phosphoserine phosphatase)
MSPPPASLPVETLGRALDALPDGLAFFDADWTIRYVNPAGACLLRRGVDELVGRNIWAALPELAGGLLHSFLLHARRSRTPLTWSGFYAPVGCRLEASAVVVDGLLQVSFRAAGLQQDDGPAGVDVPRHAAVEEDSERDRLRLLAEVSEAMIDTLDTGTSATRLADLAVTRLCDWAVVAVADEHGGVGEKAWAHRDPDRRADLDLYMAGRREDAGDDTAMVDALLTGQPVRVPMIHDEVVAPSLPTEEVRAAWRRLNATSCTVVPLRARGETFGALAMLNTGDRRPHTEMEIATAVEVARRGALALDNARLFGRQQAVAEKLQRSLLTDPPQPDDLELAVRYRPALMHMHVGGDWYDAFTQPDGATLAVIGDVVGHNVDAAAAMGQIRSILRGIAYDRPDTPACVLTRVDTVLSGLDVGTLATALVARIEQPEAQRHEGMRTLRWSSAGHLPPLLLRPDGTVRLLATPPERLLGTDDPGRRSNHQTVLCPGDTLLLYTDGLVEHGHTGLDDGIDRLSAVAAELHALPVDQFCDELLDRLLPCRGDDDVALLVVRCHPQSPLPPST